MTKLQSAQEFHIVVGALSLYGRMVELPLMNEKPYGHPFVN